MELAGESLRIHCAKGFCARLLGLRAWPDREAGAQALLLPRCRCIHTFGLPWPIDVVFVSAAGDVLEARTSLQPNRIAWCASAWGVLELPARYTSSPGWLAQFRSAWVASKIDA